MINRWTGVLSGLALVLLALIILIPRFGREVNKIQLDLPSNPTRIVVSNPEGNVTLQRVGQEWVVASLDVAASPPRVRAITSALDPGRHYPVVAMSAAPGQYGLDGSTEVTLADAAAGTTVTLGGLAADGQNIYARVAATEAIILLPAAIAGAARGTTDSFRDPVVTRLPEEAIQAIRLFSGESLVVELSRNPAADPSAQPDQAEDVIATGSAARVERIAREWSVERGEADVQPYQIENMLQELAALTASGFPLDGETSREENEAVATIEIIPVRGPPPDSAPIRLTVYERKGATQTARLSNYDRVFLLDDRRTRRLLMGLVSLPH